MVGPTREEGPARSVPATLLLGPLRAGCLRLQNLIDTQARTSGRRQFSESRDVVEERIVRWLQ